MLRFLTAGESHGQALVVIVEGLPAGLEITVDEIQVEMARRRLGYGRGPRQRFEHDELTLIGGVRHGRTLGSPVAIEIKNSEWFRSDKWHEEMSPAPGATKDPLTQVRPGHADLAGMQKYGFTDARDVLERASARETAARVAAGALAKKLLSYLGVEIISHVIQLGDVQVAPGGARPTPADLDAVDADEVRCFDPAASELMVDAIKAAAKEGDSLGGVVEVLGFGVPVGLGSHVHWDRKLDALLAQALMSIQAVKGVEIGDGFEVAGRLGSQAHDAIRWNAETASYTRLSTLAGGLEGGMTNGELLVARAAMKPLATLNRPTLETVDTATKESAVSFKERTDVTAVSGDGRRRRDDGRPRARAGGAAQVRRRLGRRVRPQRRSVPTHAVSARTCVLVGLMGVGKTTVGRVLADRLGRELVDSDERIEALTGRTVKQILADGGVIELRRREADALFDALADARAARDRRGRRGGARPRPPEAPARRRCRRRVADRRARRCSAPRTATRDHRPWLDDDPVGTLQRMYDERRDLYREVADRTVAVDGLTPERGGRAGTGADVSTPIRRVTVPIDGRVVRRGRRPRRRRRAAVAAARHGAAGSRS